MDTSKKEKNNSALGDIVNKVAAEKAVIEEKPVEVKKAVDPVVAERKKRLKALGYATGEADFDNNVSTNLFELPPSVRDEIAAKGLYPKFISMKKFKENSNMHFRGFKPYIMEERLSEISPDIDFQVNPEGMILRGQMVLAVKPQKYVDNYREAVQKENDKLAGIKEDKYREMKEYGARRGFKFDVDE